MSVLVWVMGDGEHQDMIATCRTGNGEWLTMKWDWREDGGLLGFSHDTPLHADALLEEWTEDFEANGSRLIAGPTELFITGPDNPTDREMMRWWNYDLRPIVMSLDLQDPADLQFDEECTLRLPPATGIHAAWETLAKHPSPYREKLAWGS